jgi:hypothetical protein
MIECIELNKQSNCQNCILSCIVNVPIIERIVLNKRTKSCLNDYYILLNIDVSLL